MKTLKNKIYRNADILNGIDALAYIADLKTFKLLFVNKAAKDAFHLRRIKGLTCYEAFYNRKTPCEFCKASDLREYGVIKWGIHNPTVKKTFELWEYLINYRTRKAMLEIAIDITDRENEKFDLLNALSSEQLLEKLIRLLQNTQDLETALDEVLHILGGNLQADRAYIFNVENGKMSNTHEWCKDGVVPQIDNLQDFDVSYIDAWTPYFERGECVEITNLEDIKETRPEEYSVLKPQNINTLVAAPIYIGKDFVGYIGLDNPPVDRIKNIQPLLLSLTYFISSSMVIKSREEELKLMSFTDKMTGVRNRNAFIRKLENLKTDKFLSSIGIAYTDINHLKLVNDTSGHDAGDDAIIFYANKLTNFFRRNEIFRVGGDEFVVLCCDISEENFNARMRQLIDDIKSESNPIASIGCVWETSDGSNIEKLLKKADRKMYDDKQKDHGE